MKAIVNEKETFIIEKTAEGWMVNGKKLNPDILHLKEGRYHVIADNKSVSVEVISSDTISKKHTLKINGQLFDVQLRDQYDDLLQALGMDEAAGKKTGDLKAPMPGLVVSVAVEEGALVKKGDTLVVLEAMKMENSLKAAGDATVKKILVQKGVTVEKNQVLIQLG